MQSVNTFIIYSDFWNERQKCYECSFSDDSLELRIYPDLIGFEDNRLFIKFQCDGISYEWGYLNGDLSIRKTPGENVYIEDFSGIIPTMYFDFWNTIPEEEQPVIRKIFAMAVNRSRSKYYSDPNGYNLHRKF